MAATATRRGTKASAPVVEETEGDEDEFEELEEDDTDELEELEDESEPAPKAKAAKKTATATKRADTPKFGSAELAAHVTEATGETYDARGIRMLLRKLAADGKLERVVGETRDRYSFSGPADPIVKAVVAMVKDGTAKALKQEGLQKVKDAAAAKKAAKKAETVEDEGDMDEVEETPKPRTRRAAKPAAPAKATPAKATPARRRAATPA